MVTAHTHNEEPDLGRGTDREAPHLALVPIAEVTESPLNPRTHFDGLEELAESIAKQGVLQPIRVRPSTGATDYELVFGARRLRAARLAGLTQIPAIVGDLTDGEVAEAQLVENDQRDDVHPLEQARAYRRVLEISGRDVDWIASQVGRSSSYIHKALKLLELGPKAQALWIDQHPQLPPSVVIHFARLPEALQDAALALALEDAGSYALTSRTVGPWLRARYFLRLADAPFDTKAKALIATAGPCTTCPKNTAAAAKLDLFDEPDLAAEAMCTDRACHKAKADAEWAARKVEAQTLEGPAIITGKPSPDLAARIPRAHADSLDRTARAELADLVVLAISRGPTGEITEYVNRKAQDRIVTEAGERLLKAHPIPAEPKSAREEKAPPVAVAAVAMAPLREADFVRVEVRRVFRSGKREGWVAEADGYGTKSAIAGGMAAALRSLTLELEYLLGAGDVEEPPQPKASKPAPKGKPKASPKKSPKGGKGKAKK